MNDYTKQGFASRFNNGSGEGSTGSSSGGAKPVVQSKGQLIMEVAEMLRPALTEKFRGYHDENGNPVQPARIRGMALIIAQELVNAKPVVH